MGYVETLKNISQKRIFIYWGGFPLIWTYWQTEKEKHHCKEMIFSVSSIQENGGTAHDLYYPLGYRPYDVVIDSTHRLAVSWAPATCVGCRARGGTKDKPDFLTNDHK